MSRFMLRGMVAIALVAVTVSMASAQERERGGRRGGFSGFGGGGSSALLGMPEVQKEIGLSEADAKKLTDELRALWPERTGNREESRNLSEEERQKRSDERRKQFEEIGKKSDEKIKATLTEAQYKRLGELRVQREGAGALSRADIAEKLKLTTEQKEQIAKLQEAGRGRRGEGGNQGERPSAEEFRARREKLNADVVAVLTPEQKTAWESMQGAKFEFPAPTFGGGRPRGNRPAAE